MTDTPSNYENRRHHFLGAFIGAIEPVETSVTYRLGIGVVAIVMIVLPIIYLAIIALVGYAVFYHAVNHIGMLGAVRGRGVILVFVAYLAPMVAGGFLLLFMLKPIFTGFGSGPTKRSLRPEDEPLLFEFVYRICEAVNAPRPKQIDVDCEVNASASFRRGMLSFLTGNDLVLTIGTPLVAGLTTRQFAGVLAHEFGHFSQGAGMRLTYVIRRISYWLTRAVYDRDEWDERLVALCGWDLRISWVFFVTRLFVWLTRRILWCLMWIGHAVSSYMLREMEFDADRYEARLAGSRTFESTARQLAMLNFANQKAQRDLASFYREGRLGNDLPRLIASNASQFDSKLRKKINDYVDEQTTGHFDTHPSDSERIANARQEQTEGIFTVARPASELFHNFPHTSKITTLDYFRQLFGSKFRAESLHDIDDILVRQRARDKSFQALDRYLQGCFFWMRPLDLSAGPNESHRVTPNGRRKTDSRVYDPRL